MKTQKKSTYLCVDEVQSALFDSKYCTVDFNQWRRLWRRVPVVRGYLPGSVQAKLITRSDFNLNENQNMIPIIRREKSRLQSISYWWNSFMQMRIQKKNNNHARWIHYLLAFEVIVSHQHPLEGIANLAERPTKYRYVTCTFKLIIRKRIMHPLLFISVLAV